MTEEIRPWGGFQVCLEDLKDLERLGTQQIQVLPPTPQQLAARIAELEALIKAALLSLDRHPELAKDILSLSNP